MPESTLSPSQGLRIWPLCRVAGGDIWKVWLFLEYFSSGYTLFVQEGVEEGPEERGGWVGCENLSANRL